MEVTWDDILRAVRKSEGIPLRTIGGRATFTARVEGPNLFVTPTSTGYERRCSTGSRKLLAEFNRTRSMTASDYQGMTFNSVYMLRLIEMAMSGR